MSVRIWDIDVVLIVDHEEHERRMREGRLTWVDLSLCDWDGGYVDGKYADVAFLERVASDGSEPARYAFEGSRVLFSHIDGLDDVLARVVRYPLEGRERRIERFAAQLLAWRWYHSEVDPPGQPLSGRAGTAQGRPVRVSHRACP